MRSLLALTACFALAACATSSATPPDTTVGAPATPPPVGTISATTPVGASVTWSTTLMSMNASGISGTARVTPSGNGEAATVSIRGATAGGAHPWHVHMGTCASGGGVFGPAMAYTPLTVGSDGAASATAQLPARLDAMQKYHVNIHASPTDMGTIVACGDLSPASM